MPITANLTHGWPLTANSNDEIGTDNGSDANITYSGGFAVFNGTTSKIALGTALARGAAISVALWVKWSGGTGMIICDSDIPGANTWYLNIQSDGTLRFSWASVGGNNQQFGTTNPAIADANLHCIFITQTAADAVPVIKVDDVSLAVSSLSNSGTTLPTAQGTDIGEFGLLSGQFYNGSMKFLYLWDAAKSAADATTFYNGGTPLQNPFVATSGGIMTALV